MKNLRMNHPVFTLLAHLFRQFLAETDRTTEDAKHVRVRDFYRWAKARVKENVGCDYPLFPEAEELAELHGFTHANFQLVTQIMHDPFSACQQLYYWWPMLCLRGKNTGKHKAVAVSLGASIKYEDGTTAHIPLAVGPQCEPYMDGLLLTTLRTQLQLITNTVLAVGLDKIHDHAAVSGVVIPVQVNASTPGLTF